MFIFTGTGIFFSFINKLSMLERDAPDIRPDNPAFFISGIRRDTGFTLPDIRPDNGF
jgi:hypothetical protein